MVQPTNILSFSSLSNSIDILHRNLKRLGRRSDVLFAQRIELGVAGLAPHVLHVDGPVLRLGRGLDLRKNAPVLAGCVVLLRACAVTGGVEAGRVLGREALDAEVVGAATGRAAEGEVGGVPC